MVCGPHADAEQRVEMRRGAFLVGNNRFDLRKPGFFEHARQCALGKPQLSIGIEFPGLFELVGNQIQHNKPTAGFQDAECGIDGTLRVFRMVQCLTQDGQIERLVGELIEMGGFYPAIASFSDSEKTETNGEILRQ